jgi:hypothetical protein
LREALAAADHDYILTESSKPGQSPKRPRALRAKERRVGLPRLKARKLMGFAVGALCVAALGGIAFNALTLQKTRHPAPLFAHAPSVPAAKAPAVAEVNAPPPAAPAAPRPPQAATNREEAASSSKSVTEERAALSRSHPAPDDAAEAAPRDAISQLLLGKTREAETSQPAASSATVRAVQKALLKLGFVVKADGVMGATTRNAIERFERDHGRASTGDLTPAVQRRLAAQSGIPIN